MTRDSVGERLAERLTVRMSLIPNVTLKAGFLGVKSRQHSLVITNHRILFARTTVARMIELSRRIRARVGSGGPTLGSWGGRSLDERSGLSRSDTDG